jgi:hypothetical protein
VTDATPNTGAQPSVNATTGESAVDSFAAKVRAHLSGRDAPPPAEPEEQEEAADDTGTELPESDTVSAQDGDAEEAEKADDAESDEADESEDADSEEQSPRLTSLKDLADALETDVDDLLSLALPTKVDGEEGQTTLRDLLKSYQTEQHLTRKGQKLADERRDFDQKRQEAEKATQERIQSLDVALQLANQRLLGKFARLDWNALRETNPQGYQQAYIEYQQLYGELAQASQALQQEQARYAEQQTREYDAFVTEQRRLWAQHMPHWADSKVKAAELNELREYVKSKGIDPTDLDRVSDFRYGQVMHDALQWHRLQAKTKDVKKAVKSAGPVVKPGIRKSGAAVNADAIAKTRDRLRKSGSTEALADLIKLRRRG